MVPKTGKKFDSLYVKKDLVCLVAEYKNLDLIGSVRADSVIYDLAPELSGNMAYVTGKIPVKPDGKRPHAVTWCGAVKGLKCWSI